MPGHKNTFRSSIMYYDGNERVEENDPEGLRYIITVHLVSSVLLNALRSLQQLSLYLLALLMVG